MPNVMRGNVTSDEKISSMRTTNLKTVLFATSLSLCVFFLSIGLAADVRPATPETMSRVMNLARAALENSPASPTDASLKFLTAFTTEFGDVLPNTRWIHRSDAIEVSVSTPLVTLRWDLYERLRTSASLATVRPPAGVAIRIEPLRLDSPDITKVVVTRNGKAVDSIGNTLRASTLTNAFGASVQRQAGDVIFPVEAFDPAGIVSITVTPASGMNIVRIFGPGDLANLK